MAKDFTQVMSERTDKQLVDIVTLKRDEYQPEAVLAAEREIELRKINIDTFYSPEQILENKIKSQVNKSDIEFQWHHKLFTFLLPLISVVIVNFVFNLGSQASFIKALGFPIIFMIHYGIYRMLKDQGYTKMAKHFIQWVTYTLFIYIGLLLVVGLAVYFFFM